MTSQQCQKSKSKKKSKSGTALGKRKRQQNRIRKSENQIQVLINEFKITPEWTKERVAELSEMTGLSESQVYKWNWDQRKKFNQDFDQIDAEVTRDEFGGYCCKRWGKLEDFGGDDDNICQILGFDVDSKALELVKSDLEKRLKSSSPDKMIIKSSTLLLQKKDKLRKMSAPSTPNKALEVKKNLIVVKPVQMEEVKNDATACDSNSKSTADSCQSSWLNNTQKSPMPVFDPAPFNILSPWKYDSQMTNAFVQQQQNAPSSFQLKTPQMFHHSPMKTPFKQMQASWTLSSPYVEDKGDNQNMSNSKNGFYKSSCLLNFASRQERLNFSPGM